MAARRLRLDGLRLPRRTYTVRLALDQLAVRHRGLVRLSQGQLLLLQGVVGTRAGTAFVSALELGSAGWRTDFGLGAFQSRRGRSFPERQEPGFAEGPAADPLGVEGEVRTGCIGGARKQRWKSRFV